MLFVLDLLGFEDEGRMERRIDTDAVQTKKGAGNGKGNEGAERRAKSNNVSYFWLLSSLINTETFEPIPHSLEFLSQQLFLQRNLDLLHPLLPSF